MPKERNKEVTEEQSGVNRRSFLSQLGAAGIAVPVLPVAGSAAAEIASTESAASGKEVSASA